MAGRQHSAARVGVPAPMRTSLLLATKVPMRDQDVILMANARTDQLGKLFGLIAQFSLPFLVGRQLIN